MDSVLRNLVRWGAVWVGLLVWGCQTQEKSAGAPVTAVWERPPAASAGPGAGAETAAPDAAAATRPGEAQAALAPEEIAAVVNGTAITRSRLVNMLVEGHGLNLLEQLILLEAARRRGESMGLSVSAADVKAAHEDALRQLATPLGSAETQPMELGSAQALLDEFLLAKNISRAEWDLRMQQRAWLRKIAEAETGRQEVSEKILREQYAMDYGERVQIRHIQVSSAAAVRRVRAALAENKDFELVAREMSENQITAGRGGLLPPFTRNDLSVPPLIRETAFGMEPGQVSPPLVVETWQHIIRVERKFPASEVGFENVDQQKLKARWVDRAVRQRMEELEGELFQGAAVDVRDPVLARQFREKHRRR